MKQVGWRITLITTVPPVAAALVPTLRELGHDPVAVVSARRKQPGPVGREPMGDETAFVPGHGPMSTFAHERATNPFVGDRVLSARA